MSHPRPASDPCPGMTVQESDGSTRLVVTVGPADSAGLADTQRWVKWKGRDQRNLICSLANWKELAARDGWQVLME